MQPANLLGGSYSDVTKPWSVQDTVNWIPEMAAAPGTRTPAKFRDAPGLRPFSYLGAGAIRGARNVEGTLFVVAGSILYQVGINGSAIARGTIPGVGLVQMSHNQRSGGYELLIVNGSSGYVWNTHALTFTKITDDGYPGAVSVDYVDSYLVQVEPFGRFWFHSDLADALSYNTLDRYESEASPDGIVAIAVSHFEVVVFNKTTTEFFYNTGATTGTFASKRVVIQHGCAGRNTVVSLADTLFWLGDDGVWYRLDGYSAVPISTPPMDAAFAQCNWERAFSFAYESEGHKIVYLTFPDGKTWGYDVTTGLVHRRQSFGLDRWRINTLTFWNKQWIAGDCQSGKLYVVDWDHKLEDDKPLVSERISSVLHNNQGPLGIPYLELLFDTGGEPTQFEALVVDLSLAGDLPDARVTDSGTYQYAMAGNIAPVTASILSGALPPGATMDATAKVTYAYTTLGTYNWVVRATDAAGNHVDLADSAVISAYPMPLAIAHWPLDDSNMTARDISGNHFDLTYSSTVVKNAAVISPSGRNTAQFVAADASFASAATMTTADPRLYVGGTNPTVANFAIAAWIKPAASASTTNRLIAQVGDSLLTGSVNWRLDLQTAGAHGLQGTAGVYGTANDVGGGTVADAAVSLVMLSCTNGVMTLCVNGAQVGISHTNTQTSTLTTGGHMMIGGDVNRPLSYGYVGYMADVMLFDSGFTPAQAAQLYTDGPNVIRYKLVPP